MTKNVSHSRLLVGKRLTVELNQIDSDSKRKYISKRNCHLLTITDPTNFMAPEFHLLYSHDNKFINHAVKEK